MVQVKRLNIKIKANPNRVLPLFMDLKKKERIAAIVSKIVALDDQSVELAIGRVFNDFENRHFDFKETILKHFETIENKVVLPEMLSLSRKFLIGAYFTKEYSIESAALFNPSIVVHPDQNGCNNDSVRFIMSLRATGEGHISSIVFRTGFVSKEGEVSMDKVSNKTTSATKNKKLIYQKSFINERARLNARINPELFNYLPDEFSEMEAYRVIDDLKAKNLFKLNGSKRALAEIFDTNYDLTFNNNKPLSNRVIFPSSKKESMGMEDVRFVHFSDNNKREYIGTYTAYNGKNTRIQIIKTNDFNTFEIRSLYGKAAKDKGMALFPEKINGKYAMVGRQEGNSISIMYSDNLYFWDNYKVIQKPERDWEITQLGNSGSPVKTLHGWLLLTHAVGPLRKYVLSATLLDLNNPEKVLATLPHPLLSPNEEEREGYVPNVVYTCGFLQHGNKLIIPYAISDSATSFATVDIHLLLEKLLKNIQ
ncbi:MAG: glycosidase [Bacteroidetes bacterium]|nr:MAG: glycosidase [Bacteroidota bacterium]